MSRGEDTPQYKIIQRLMPELTIAVQDNLCDLSNRLLSHGLITTENHEVFMNDRGVSTHVRASNLIRTVLNKIKLDVRHYSTFVSVLEENECLYESVLQKLRPRDEGIVIIDQLPLPPTADREQSDSETSPFLPTPYAETKDGSRLRQRCTIRGKRHSYVSEPCCMSLCVFILMELLSSVVGWVIGILVSYYYRYSGCHNGYYLLALIIIVGACELLFMCNVICVYVVLDVPDLFSKNVCLMCSIPWLIFVLVWFCAYQHLCTT